MPSIKPTSYTSRTDPSVVVEAVRVVDARHVRRLKEATWIDGTISILSYLNGDDLAYIGHDQPRGLLGQVISYGQWIRKGPAGDIKLITNEQMRREFNVPADDSVLPMDTKTPEAVSA